jgi:hypothetical protein
MIEISLDFHISTLDKSCTGIYEQLGDLHIWILLWLYRHLLDLLHIRHHVSRLIIAHSADHPPPRRTSPWLFDIEK